MVSELTKQVTRLAISGLKKLAGAHLRYICTADALNVYIKLCINNVCILFNRLFIVFNQLYGYYDIFCTINSLLYSKLHIEMLFLETLTTIREKMKKPAVN